MIRIFALSEPIFIYPLRASYIYETALVASDYVKKDNYIVIRELEYL